MVVTLFLLWVILQPQSSVSAHQSVPVEVHWMSTPMLRPLLVSMSFSIVLKHDMIFIINNNSTNLNENFQLLLIEIMKFVDFMK